MALSLLFDRRVEESIAGVTVDTSVSELHRYDSQVTRFPVENGSSKSDHIFNDPIQLVMEPIISDNPIQLFSLGSDLIDRISGQSSRSKTAAEELIRIQSEKQIFTVVTNLRVYENMAFSSLEFKPNQSTGKAIRFSASFIEVQTVTSRTVSIERDQLFDEFKEQASIIDEGKQSTEEFDRLQETRSVLSRLFLQ